MKSFQMNLNSKVNYRLFWFDGFICQIKWSLFTVWKFPNFFYHSDFTWNLFWIIHKFQNCRFSIGNFLRSKTTKNHKSQNSKPLKCVKMAFFNTRNLLLLISQKILTDILLKFPHCVVPSSMNVLGTLQYNCWTYFFVKLFPLSIITSFSSFSVF